MTTNTQFSIRLASGKEQTFESAAAMAAWMDQQREFYAVGKRSTRERRKREKTKAKNDRASNVAPLARYANRHSGEA